ncbi:MAG: hypothetical protein JRI23_11900, partial [Deltaproteobacteria bacterium]|nr:hypothetical protein [Deltaproteobacteria bacterium]MBW2532411.1 hypothetical protein [Deltaproteobacteria bacterium]
MKRLLLLTIVGCGTTAVSPEPAPGPPVAPLGTSASSATVSAASAGASTSGGQAPPKPTATAEASTAPTASAPPPPPPLSGPVASAGSIRCGDGHCLLPQHACCEGMLPSGDKAATCAPFKAYDWAEQLTACQGFHWVETISHCDSDEDCPSDEVCCTDFVGEVEVVSRCKPVPASGESPCTLHQRCLVEGAPCRQPNAVCRDGQCKRSNVAVDCGKAGR